MSELPATLASPRRSIAGRVFAFAASFGIAVVVLSFLLLLTWLGTVSQVEMSLFDVQKKYFDSFFFLQEVGPLKVPLPGAFLLMAILFVNMVCGGIIRIRKNWRTVGVVIAHLSILVLLAAGAVSFFFKREGHLRLFEGQSGTVFTSYQDRVIEIREVGKDGPVLMIPEARFSDCTGGTVRKFFAGSLPFELTVSDYAKNADGESVAMRAPAPGTTVVDSFYLASRPAAMQAEANFAGCVVTIKEPAADGKAGLLWEAATAPWTYRTADGRVFALRLARQSWELPFTVTLNRFTHEKHPGTNKPKVFASDVVKRQDSVDQPVKIEMNKPLRSDGFTLFQASWGPPDWQPGMPREKLYSVFAVVKNPSDKWPIFATIMAAAGIGLHFCMKLAAAVSRSAKKRAAHPAVAPIPHP